MKFSVLILLLSLVAVAQSPAPQQDTDAPIAQPARKAVKDAKALPSRKHAKTDTSVAEKESRGQKSLEALARAGLHYSGETPAELPAQWRGFLLDHRAVRFVGVAPGPTGITPCRQPT